MKVRFLADADLNKAIVSGVLRREPSIDFLSACVAGLRAMTDAEVLALAAEHQRILVSHDVGTMPAQFRAFREAGNHSPGLFLIPQTLDVGTAIDELLLIWLASEASDWHDRLEWLPLGELLGRRVPHIQGCTLYPPGHPQGVPLQRRRPAL